ncbi:hypothetical protein HK099_007160 [Clydaea vesicula]|uniref:2-oxoisovalerate dehydrogenase subunit alpha n=1 Tax=Clydaea vesicula TaxID=447962 RepID=A0AAD5TX76_9FUNG|nr:hypothetical protein HK099_007160 [Clydaea vesicula]
MYRITKFNKFLSIRLFSSKTASQANFPGAVGSNFTTTLKFLYNQPAIDTYSVLDNDGNLTVKESDPKLSKESLLKMYKNMITLNTMDLILYEAQRQGRISFYMTSYGEEATHMGSAEALNIDDVIFGQYREAGVLLHRGFTIDQFMNQCYSNELDLGKGRQMPVHYGTQLPQAAGAAYALKRQKKNACVVCYFGEGAASEGDFHAALNIASTTDSPVIYFCRNNGYAISTPAKEQYRGDGIASRGVGYGMHTIRVDGNDILAVYNATKEAKRIAVSENRPILIEAMTYRVGHHSTSDDSTAYRSKQEIADWQKVDSPITRFRKYLEKLRYWSEEEEKSFKKEIKKKVMTSFAEAEKRVKPAVKEMWEDVYGDGLPPILKEQKKELDRLMKKYPDVYNQDGYAK